MAVSQQKRDYYQVLGVARNAGADEIRQAYRNLAKQYHPDRNPGTDTTDRFREIAEAYAVLADDTKRRAYDSAGHAGVSERWSTEDIFRSFKFDDFFGGRMGDIWSLFREPFGGRAAPRPRGADIRHELSLTLEQAAQGGDQIIQVSRSDRCRTCAGTGAKPGTQPVSCSECHGSGEKQQVRSDKTMRVVTLASCTRCKGRGLYIEAPCEACSGNGVEFSSHKIKVQIPPGVEHGVLLRLSGQGEAGAQGAPSGDLLVRVYLQPHARLERDGDDLYTRTELSFADAALGAKVTVPCLNGERVKVAIPPGTQSGTALRLRGKGMPRQHERGRGDLYVIAEVKTPTHMTPRQRELLKEFSQLERDSNPTPAREEGA